MKLKKGNKRNRRAEIESYIFGRAYRDGLYSIMLEEIERILSDRKKRERVLRLTRDLPVARASSP